MFSNNQRKGLKAWVRYDGNNNAVASSLIFLKDKPKVGKWKEYMDVNLCCPTDCTPNYGQWNLVTGGAAGDGVVVVDNLASEKFTFVGPNDDEGNGWVYLTKKYTTETCLEIDYNWTSFDEGLSVDWPIYCLDATQPTGEPSDLTPRVESTPESGTWTVTVPAGQWFSVGVYSSDSCCGRGFLSINVNVVECTTTTTTTTMALQPTILTIVNNSSINHGANAGTFYVIYNGTPATVQSGSTLNAGETMTFLGNSTLDSNNVLQLYSNSGLLPFYIDTVLNSVTSDPIVYSSLTDNGTNSPFVNGMTVDSTIVANGITITLIDQPV